jgi:mRNA-degrading endonuclease RelE of RelBE toxin-antitoxin system
MNSIVYSNNFKSELKPLAKKYYSLRESIDTLISNLLEDPFLGESYGNNIYKIRLSDKSKGKGKRGGFRVVYYLKIQTADSTKIILINIFDKSDRDTITKKEVERILKGII